VVSAGGMPVNGDGVTLGFTIGEPIVGPASDGQVAKWDAAPGNWVAGTGERNVVADGNGNLIVRAFR